MKRVSFVSALIAGFLLFSAQVVPLHAVPVQQRLRQGVLINGQQAEGVTVIQNGQVQSFTCSAPQPYTTLDNSSSGWACLDQSTGIWLLNAVPPQQTEGIYDQPPAYYPDDSYYYSGAYPYYPYSFWGGPAFSFGFGSGGGHGHDYYEHGHHEFHGHEGGHGGGHVEGGHGGHSGGGHQGGQGGGGGHGGGGHR
jgi:hypothetical protein